MPALSTERPPGRWTPTFAFLQVSLLAGVLIGAALVLHRLDLLVIGTPFAIVTGWCLATRPSQVPRPRPESVTSKTPVEGVAQRWDWTFDDVDESAEQMITTLGADDCVRTDPANGVLIDLPTGGCATASVRWLPARWGRRTIFPARTHFLSPWGGFIAGPFDTAGTPLTVRPAPQAFTGKAALPHPIGLVGQNRSRRMGDGSEFAEIREFRTGDRLRRISWPITARTGQLHVRTSYAEQDTEVLILLDASSDFGQSRADSGVDSSLDLGMRCALAVAGHFLTRGERVGVRALGTVRSERIRPAAGAAQYQRIADTLMTVESAGVRALPRHGLHLNSAAGALIILISPLMNPEMLAIAAEVAQRGRPLVVVDALPDNVDVGADSDVLTDLALRLRLMERAQEIRALQQHGAPVVSWRGPGSLDHVLLQLSRRPPRAVRR
ncbi:DUF58 domain-containing protein [Leekyejoonella antrihumi]|uniref:DUF58 domain-containing protein n=1 Tax=Leekyejoonella antrihumi TaxID=1660198 RepID=A0A563E521_9MICO|nr:DUF58 domain-containing protein [Leekyejoonella antrihumi]TWP37658.1 DUF58 domain-containing protein [Leekyejoonella antrihumi]